MRYTYNMNDTEFEGLEKLLQQRGGAAIDALRLHLVDGLSIPQAARQVGITSPGVYRLHATAQERLTAARQALGIAPPASIAGANDGMQDVID